MKEEQIRPQKIFVKYIKLAIKDTSIFFNKNTIKSNINCIACNKKGKSLFVKHNFTYALCFHCFSIYVSPRPNQKIFFDYYLNSNSSKYWASTFYKKTEKSRKNKLWKPKAKKIISILKKYFLDKPKGVRGRSSDNKLIKKIIGWEPNTKLEKGLENTYYWIYNELSQNLSKTKFSK